MVDVREAQTKDGEHVRRLTASVFADFAMFQKLLPKFFATPGVTTYLASSAGEVVGFVMLGFLPWTGGRDGDNPWIADILAIGVDPGHQRKGIGSALMHQALELVRLMEEWRELKEIQLTCDASNQGAVRFFEKHGLQVVQAKLGTFLSGQSAIRLTKKLS